jgi:Serine dehydrogenase proteinase
MGRRCFCAFLPLCIIIAFAMSPPSQPSGGTATGTGSAAATTTALAHPGEQVPTVEPRKPSCDPEHLYAPITEVLQKVRNKRGNPLFALVADRITDDTLKEVFSWRKELREAGKHGSFDVLVHSPGGNLTACYMVARLLSRFANKWEAIVPEIAGSGATLICLGSSNIVMSEIAQLGPLDPQVASKKRERFFVTERQSPLEAFEALRYLREFAVSSLDALMEVLTDKGIAPQKALETAVTIASELVKPVIEKIDPYDLGAFSLDNTLAINYCKEVARHSDSVKQSQRKAYYKSLVQGYPVHEFAIDLVEAQNLKLTVSEPTEDVDDLLDLFRVYATRTETYIGLVPPAEEAA